MIHKRKYLLLGTVLFVVLAFSLASIALASPTLETDKADYAPGETVQFTGSGYDSNTSYALPVLRPDDSIVKGDGSFEPGWDITDPTDGSGNLAYSYQLNGIAGEYEGRVYPADWTGNWDIAPIASVFFTDAPPAADLDQCRNGPAAAPEDCGDGWVNGAVNATQGHMVEGFSVPYRQIMTDMPTDGTVVTMILEYDITNTSGGASTEVAIDFLTHYDMLEPHAPFGHPAEIISPTYGITDPISDTITTFAIPAPTDPGGELQVPLDAAWNEFLPGEKVFTLFGGTISDVYYVSQGDFNGAGESTQIAVEFTVDSATAVLAWGGHIARAADWGEGNSAGGISGSPYHMRQEDWNLNNLGNQDMALAAGAVTIPGEIIIVKNTDLADDSFNFTGTGVGVSPTFTITTQSYTGAATFGGLLPGSYSFTELGPAAGWGFDSLTCDPSSAASITGQMADITLAEAQTVTCTYANVVQRGSITVKKYTIGGFGIFTFTTDYLGGNPIELTTASGNNPASSATTHNLTPGDYNITELGPDIGWEFGGVVCNDDDWPDATPSDQTATITLDPNEDVTCTFTNYRLSNLTVVKLTEGGDGPFRFESSTLPTSPFTITTSSGTGSMPFTNLDAGTYDVAEVVPYGWDLIDSYCDNGDDPGAIELGYGQNVTCTFEDRKRGRLNVVKLTEGGDDAFRFESSTLPISPFTITTSSGVGQTIFTNLISGTYDVAEVLPYGWDLIATYCSNGDEPDAVDVGPGETVTCTFEDRKRGSLTVVKLTEGGDDAFRFESSTLPISPFTITTSSGVGQTVFTNLISGTYDVAEVLPYGWDLIATYCSNGDEPDAVDVGPGQNVTCTFEDRKRGRLNVVKLTEGGDGPFRFESSTLPISPFTITTSSGVGQTVFTNLISGTYDVAEVLPYGWDLIAHYCDNGDDPAAVDVGPGQEVTCTFENRKRGRLNVVKLTEGADGPFRFESITLPITPFTITTSSGVGQAVFTNLFSGTYDVAEVLPYGWDLIAHYCDNGDDPAAVDVGPGQEVTCTFENRKRGRLNVVKLTEGADGPFRFESITLPITPFTITTSSGVGQAVFTNLFSGTYDVAEVLPYGWDLIAHYCDNGDDPAAVDVGPGEEITCTFENRKRGRLNVVKLTEGADGPFRFESSTLPISPFTITTSSGVGQAVFTNLFSGTYDVAEVLPYGWDLIASYCDNGDDPDAIDVGPGEEITCTFENRKRGRLNVVKLTEGGDDAFRFESSTLPISPFTITTSSGVGQTIFTNLISGTYDVAEVLPYGWDLIATYCSNGDEPDAVDVGPGETVTCTFENRKRGRLNVVKLTEGGDGAFRFESSLLPISPFTITTLSGVGQGVFTNLISGTYDVAEVVPTGWILDDYYCDNGDDPAAVAVGPGEEVTCTFENKARARLEVEKIVIWHGQSDESQTFEICIEGPSYPVPDCQIFDWDGGVYAWENLIPGDYTVTETNPGSGWQVNYIPGQTITLEPGDSGSITVENEQGYLAWTPGFWKNHTENAPSGHNAWPYTGHEYTESLCFGADMVRDILPGGDDLFYEACPDPLVNPDSPFLDGLTSVFEGDSLLDALNYGGGPGEIGAARILLRAGVAAYLNARVSDLHHPFPGYEGYAPYPLTAQEVLDLVNAALASGDRQTMLTLAKTLDDYNNGGSEFWPFGWD